MIFPALILTCLLLFGYFKILILQGLVAARKHSDKLMSLVDIMRAGEW